MRIGAHHDAQVDHIDDSHFYSRYIFLEQPGCGAGLERRNVSSAGQNDIGFSITIVRGKLPSRSPSGAVSHRLVHIQPLKAELFAAGDDIHVVPAAQAMIEYTEEAIGVGRKINPDNLGPAVQGIADKAWRLMTESVVVVSPAVAGEKDVERCNGPSPGIVLTFLEPLGMLGKHG